MNHSARGSSALRGVQPPHSRRNFSGFPVQQSELCNEATAGKGSAVVRCPTGVRVEHFASVKRQTPQPIVPMMHRFTRRSPRGSSAISSPCRRDFSYAPNAPTAEDDCEVGLPVGPQKNRSTDSVGHTTGSKRPRGKPLLPLPSELPAQRIHGAITGLTANSEIFDSSAIQNRKGFPKDFFGKGNAHALTECLASRQWSSSSSDNSERASEQSSARTDEQRRDRGRHSSRLSSASDTGRGGGHLRWTSRKSWDGAGELGSWRDEDPDVPLDDRAEGDAGGRKVFPLMSIRDFPLMKSFGEMFC